MAMKQTQTKMFDFADAGLDFCPGSKNLFPDRFKKMLSQGYNEQTVTSVSVTGNQVTLNYGVSHGYAADRVLKINSGPLAEINDGEFWIDTVTTTSLTMTVDVVPTTITGGFSTKIASLGFELLFEQAYVHLYRFKALDESDLFLRLVYQSNLGHRNVVLVCIGKACDITTGVITDANAQTETKEAVTHSQNIPKWEFTNGMNSNQNDWTYSQGFNSYRLAILVGSRYHLSIFTNTSYTSGNNISYALTNGFYPIHNIGYTRLNLPCVFGYTLGLGSQNPPGGGAIAYINYLKAMIGTIAVKFIIEGSNSGKAFITPQATSSYLPIDLDGFNTTSTEPISVYEYNTGQFLGVIEPNCLMQVKCGTTNYLSPLAQNTPSIQLDVDYQTKCPTHAISSYSSLANSWFCTSPLIEVKYV